VSRKGELPSSCLIFLFIQMNSICYFFPRSKISRKGHTDRILYNLFKLQNNICLYYSGSLFCLVAFLDFQIWWCWKYELISPPLLCACSWHKEVSLSAQSDIVGLSNRIYIIICSCYASVYVVFKLLYGYSCSSVEFTRTFLLEAIYNFETNLENEDFQLKFFQKQK